MRVYADNAATTKLDLEAYEAMKPWLLDEYGNASQSYSFSRKPKAALKEARETIAKCINASSEEIYFTSGGTESDNWAIKGTALARSREGIKIEPYLNGGGQERNWRAGTENTAGIVGMAVALKNNSLNMAAITDHVHNLEKQLLDGLNALGITYTRNGAEPYLPGLISLSFPKRDGEALLHRLDLMGIEVSTGAACDSKKTEVSHVLSAIRLDECLAKGTIRISLGKHNTKEEVDEIIRALNVVLGNYRS